MVRNQLNKPHQYELQFQTMVFYLNWLLNFGISYPTTLPIYRLSSLQRYLDGNYAMRHLRLEHYDEEFKKLGGSFDFLAYSSQYPKYKFFYR
jgi:hypothetical protein